MVVFQRGVQSCRTSPTQLERQHGKMKLGSSFCLLLLLFLLRPVVVVAVFAVAIMMNISTVTDGVTWSAERFRARHTPAVWKRGRELSRAMASTPQSMCPAAGESLKGWSPTPPSLPTKPQASKQANDKAMSD